MEGYGSDDILQQEAEARAVMGEESELFTGQQDKEMWLYEPGEGPSVWLCLRALQLNPLTEHTFKPLREFSFDV